jgi:hypothetical protein
VSDAAALARDTHKFESRYLPLWMFPEGIGPIAPTTVLGGLALPTAVLADFGRISSWSDKSIKARWRNEAGDLFLDEAAESGCCFVAAACGYPLIGGRKSRLGETGRT